MYYYFLTIDKCNTESMPTKPLYNGIINALLLRNNAEAVSPRLSCFEYKHKSLKYPKWLHYHGIIYTEKYQMYTGWRQPGYSIKLLLVKTMADMCRIAGYIQKDKIDLSDLEPLSICLNRTKGSACNVKDFKEINTIFNYLQ